MSPLQKPHQPSRRQAVIFFLFTLILAAAIFCWVFFIDKGSLIINGPAPFDVRIGVKSTPCASAPCVLKLKPKRYTVILQKEGFFEDSQVVEIKRFQNTAATANFKFIPILREASEIVLPMESAPLKPPFLGMQTLPNFPKNAKEALFSPNENKILLSLGKEFYIYDTAAKTVGETDFAPDMRPAWLNQDIVFLEKTEEKHILKKWTVKDDKTSVLASFDRPFENPRLMGSPSGEKILIADEENSGPSYYLIDAVKKSRKKLELGPGAKKPKWTKFSDSLVFEAEESGRAKIFILNPANLEKTNIPATDSSNVEEISPHNFIFISAEKRDSEGPQVGISITEAIEEAQKETKQALGSAPHSSYLFIVEFSAEKGAFKTIIEIPVKAGEKIRRLTPDDQKWRFEKEGRLFEVVFGPGQ